MAIEAFISLMTTVIVSCLHKIHSIATMAPTAVMVAFDWNGWYDRNGPIGFMAEIVEMAVEL